MREFNVDVTIDKTFNVLAETEEEAKNLAIQKVRNMMGSYNSLEIDAIYEPFHGLVDDDEDCEFENEYEVLCFTMGDVLVHAYSIEADDPTSAAIAAKEFFESDYPLKPLKKMRVRIDGEKIDI